VRPAKGTGSQHWDANWLRVLFDQLNYVYGSPNR